MNELTRKVAFTTLIISISSNRNSHSESVRAYDALALMNLLEENKLIITRVDSTFRGILHKFDIIHKAQELL